MGKDSGKNCLRGPKTIYGLFVAHGIWAFYPSLTMGTILTSLQRYTTLIGVFHIWSWFTGSLIMEVERSTETKYFMPREWQRERIHEQWEDFNSSVRQGKMLFVYGILGESWLFTAIYNIFFPQQVATSIEPWLISKNLKQVRTWTVLKWKTTNRFNGYRQDWEFKINPQRKLWRATSILL